MCNINAVFKDSGDNITDAFADATAYSYANNGDGDGIYMSDGNVCIKGTSRLPIRQYDQMMTASEVVISHQRKATSGPCTGMFAHPFCNERFVFVHNGQFVGPVGDAVNWETSDSHRFFQRFVKCFEELNDVPKAFKKTLGDRDWSTYSVLLYDKIEKVGYYARNYGLQINISQTDDGKLMIATSDKSSDFLSSEAAYVHAKEGTLYKIVRDGKTHKWTFVGIGEIEHFFKRMDDELPMLQHKKHGSLPEDHWVEEMFMFMIQVMVFPIMFGVWLAEGCLQILEWMWKITMGENDEKNKKRTKARTGIGICGKCDVAGKIENRELPAI